MTDKPAVDRNDLYVEDLSRLQLRLANIVEAAKTSGRPTREIAEESCLATKTVRALLKKGTSADPKALTLIGLTRALGLDERGLKK